MTFGCTIKGEALLWYVDQRLSDSQDVQDRGIVQSTYIESGLLVLSNLSIPVKITNNNTKVECVGLGNGTAVNSSTVLLQLQGKVSILVF